MGSATNPTPTTKDSSPTTVRRSKRRRATTGSADFNVSFSKVRVSESSRVLRSRSKGSGTLLRVMPCDAVSKEHSYSKVSKRISEGNSSPATLHRDAFIDLTANGEKSGVEESHYTENTCRSCNTIEIIDFDDLQLSNSSYRDPSLEVVCNQKNDAQQEIGRQTEKDVILGESVNDHSNNWNFIGSATSSEGQPQCLLETAIDVINAIEQLRSDSNETSPVYLDLDQSWNLDARTAEDLTSAGSTNFSSGGCYQGLSAAPGVSQFISHGFRNPMPIGKEIPYECQWSPTPIPSNTFPNHRSPPFATSFSTSGGSIERVLSPVIPKQPSIQRSSILIPMRIEKRCNPLPEPPQFDVEPECRIHLVDTPPSFSQTDVPHLRSARGGGRLPSLQQTPLEFDVGRLKPRRTRRTQAQMEISRQEVAQHRSKSNQRRDFGGRFSLEYHKVLFPGTGCSEIYSTLNETNFFGVGSSGRHSFSNDMAAFRNFGQFWTMPTSRGFHSSAGGDGQETRSSFLWNQQVHSMQLRAGLGGPQQMPVMNSRRPWELENWSPNLNDVSNVAPINYWRF